MSHIGSFTWGDHCLCSCQPNSTVCYETMDVSLMHHMVFADAYRMVANSHVLVYSASYCFVTVKVQH